MGRDSWQSHGAGGREGSPHLGLGLGPRPGPFPPCSVCSSSPSQSDCQQKQNPSKHLNQSAHYWARCAWVDGQRSRAQHRETGEPCTLLCHTCPRVLGDSEQLQVGWVCVQACGLRGLSLPPTKPRPPALRQVWGPDLCVGGYLEPTGSMEGLISWGPRWATAAVSSCGSLLARPPHRFLTGKKSTQVSPDLGSPPEFFLLH